MENQEKPNPPDQPEESDSLDAQTTVVTSDASSDAPTNATKDGAASQDKNKKNDKKKSPIKALFARFSIYFLLFILVLLIAAMVSAISFIKSKQAAKQTAVTTEPLSEEALKQLRQSDVKVGDPKSILSVESNAIFAGKVLIRDGLEVAGQLKVGSTLNLPGVSVTGSSNFDQARINTLQVSGNATIQGQLAVQNNLTVTGSGTFGGTLTASRLNIENLITNGDLQLNRHIDAGGATPNKSDGSALGAGGTSSVSGTDTAGTISINTGGGPGPGCFVSLTFRNSYGGIPHVVITPVGAAAGGLNYYINRSAGGFSVCTISAPPAGQSFAFDYIVVD
jgi:hypothetical protein